jgi:hypothetical protein
MPSNFYVTALEDCIRPISAKLNIVLGPNASIWLFDIKLPIAFALIVFALWVQANNEARKEERRQRAKSKERALSGCSIESEEAKNARWRLAQYFVTRGRGETPYFVKICHFAGFDLLCLVCTQYGENWAGTIVILLVIMFNIWYTSTIKPQTHGKDKDNFQIVFKARDVYQNLEQEDFQVVVIFLAQITLTTQYLFAIGEVLTAQSIDHGYWLLACIVQIGAFTKRGEDNELGSRFQSDLWSAIFFAAIKYDMSAVPQSEQKVKEQGSLLTPLSSVSMVVRMMMSFTANGIIRDFLMFSLPISLMTSKEPMDFVQNATAVAFITAIDNLKTPKEYTLQKEKKKGIRLCRRRSAQ